MKLYTTKTAARVLGVKQDTVKHYAIRFKIGSQPGGPGTPYMFTIEDLAAIRERRSSGERSTRTTIQELEDREELGLGPMYNEDLSPRP